MITEKNLLRVLQQLTKNSPISQPKNNFFQANVPPLSNTQLKLPGGKDEPWYYCLGVDSTIPYVSLQGGGASQKIISWNEMIEVQPKQTVTVKNESYMLGDISINSGHDFAAKPERISLPVDVNIEIIDGGPGVAATRITPKFPADTRRCRRGYLKYQIESGNFNMFFTFTGKPIKHSFPAIDSVTGQQTFTQLYQIQPFTIDGEAPMGYGSNANLETPMAFTDQVTWELLYFSENDDDPLFVAPDVNSLFFYVLEY